MSTNPRIKWNIKGFRDLRHSPDVVAVLHDIGAEVAHKANTSAGKDLYDYSELPNRKRAVVHVSTQSHRAVKEELEGHHLLKAAE